MENGDLATQNGDVRQQTDQTVTNILNIWMPSNFYHHGWPLSSPLAGSPPMAMAASFWLLGYGYAMRLDPSPYQVDIDIIALIPIMAD
jgi:hypothetical protein